MLSLKKPSLPTHESVSSGNFFFQTFHILKFWMFLWKHYIVTFFNTVQQSLRLRSFNQFTFYVITKILVVTWPSHLFYLFQLYYHNFFLIFNFWSPFRLNVLLISISLFPPVLYNFLFSQIYSRNYSTHPQPIKVICPSSDNSRTKRANLTSFNFPLTHMIFCCVF